MSVHRRWGKAPPFSVEALVTQIFVTTLANILGEPVTPIALRDEVPVEILPMSQRLLVSNTSGHLTIVCGAPDAYCIGGANEPLRSILGLLFPRQCHRLPPRLER